MTTAPDPMDRSLRDLLARLRRIEGQVRGLQDMIRQGRECEAVLTQVRAVQAALAAVARRVLEHYLEQCQKEWEAEPDPRLLKEKLRETVGLLTKFL